VTLEVAHPGKLRQQLAMVQRPPSLSLGSSKKFHRFLLTPKTNDIMTITEAGTIDSPFTPNGNLKGNVLGIKDRRGA